MGYAEADGERQVSNTFLVALLTYLERAGGPRLVEEVMAAAGSRRPLPELLAAEWGDRDELLALAAAAEELTGDADIGRRAGEELFRSTTSHPATRAFYVSLGSPGAALEQVLDYTVKMGRGRRYRILSMDDGGCVVEGKYASGNLAHPFFCSLGLGYWPMLATLFGAVGTGLHTRCQCRGDDVCSFVIRWDPDAALGISELQAADAEVMRRISTFEQMQSVAESLARAADLPALAERIAEAVDGITPAPEVLVAITARPGRPPVLAWRGMSAASARAKAEVLLEGAGDGGGPLTAVAPLGAFGLVATIAPDAGRVERTSSRLLEAFARHAGARIEAVLSRQLAEESRQTASALLLLARALAETATETEVSECLARAIPDLVGADHSAVLRWSPETFTLRTVAHVGAPGVAAFQEFSVSEVPALYDLAARPAPFVLDRSTAAGHVAEAMFNWDEQVGVIVPLVEQGDFLGFMCAGYQTGPTLDRDAAFARLQGAADLATTAFTKARLLEAISHQALHDELTGLPNRVLLEDRVRQALREARRHGRGIALLFLDLDRFKNVNDSMGHEFGDALIQAAAERIKGALRDSDVFARMGGDEFVIALPDLAAAEDAETVAGKVLRALRAPFDIGGRSLYVSASIGVAVHPDDGDDYGALLQAADASMYAAKDAGRNTVARRRRSAQAGEGRRRLSLETELHRVIERDWVISAKGQDAGEGEDAAGMDGALEGGGIRVAYQAQVAMVDLKLVGIEALARWEHPTLGELSPAEFLPIAAECGLMPQLDRLVRRTAFRQVRRWQQTIGSVVVAVNLSAPTLSRPGLLDEMATDLAECQVDPTAIEVELTEGMVADDHLIPVVEGLAGMGIRVAIDDFGTGASVFARLQRLPLHTLKIDRSLLQGVEGSRDWSILEAIVDMSHSLGLTVVAEGVENAVQAGHLRKIGCDSGQGYLFGRPLPADEVERVLYTHLTYLDRPALAGPRRPVSPRRGRGRLERGGATGPSGAR